MDSFFLALERNDVHTEAVNCALPMADYESAENTESNQPPAKISRSIFDEIMPVETPLTLTPKMQVETEIKAYTQLPCLNDEADPVEYWRNETRFPTVKKMAEKYMPVLASSAPVGRLFSQAGRVFRADRCRLTDANFHYKTPPWKDQPVLPFLSGIGRDNV